MDQPFRPLRDGVTYREHTADLWVEARGKDIEEVVNRLVNGIYGVIASSMNVKGEGVRKEIQGEGPDLETALVELLSEVLYMFDAGPYVVVESIVSVERGEKWDRINLSGKWYEFEIPEEHMGMEVKAVTYHGTEFRREGGEMVAKVLLDL